MATVSTPVVTSVTQLLALASGGVNQSASLTATCQVTAGWELQLNIQWSHQANVSADALVYVYPSDGVGTGFDSQPFLTMALQRISTAGGNSFVQGSLRLATGIYCLQLLNSGPNSAFFGIPTAQVVSAVVNT